MSYLKAFVYTTGYIPLLGVVGAVGQQTVQITADANFYCKWITVAVEQAAALVVNWSGTVQIEDTGAQQNLFSAPVAVEMIRGNGQNPYPVEPPRLINANSNLIFTLVNRAAIVTNVQIALHGHKLIEG